MALEDSKKIGKSGEEIEEDRFCRDRRSVLDGLTMKHNTRHSCVSGLWPSSRNLKEYSVSKTGSFSVLMREGEEAPAQVGPLELISIKLQPSS
jgi:hypothetical protein